MYRGKILGLGYTHVVPRIELNHIVEMNLLQFGKKIYRSSIVLSAEFREGVLPHLRILEAGERCSFCQKNWFVAVLKNRVVVSHIFYFHPYLGKISNLTNIFQGGWNHQLENFCS